LGLDVGIDERDLESVVDFVTDFVKGLVVAIGDLDLVLETEVVLETVLVKG
jgi:hypothetical protein